MGDLEEAPFFANMTEPEAACAGSPGREASHRTQLVMLGTDVYHCLSLTDEENSSESCTTLKEKETLGHPSPTQTAAIKLC